MIVLGINEDHNATAALIRDGEVVACVSEERFTQIKNDVGYPYKAIEFVLKKGGISPEDCDKIALASYIQDPVAIKTKRVTRYTIKDYVKEMYEHWKPVLLENQPSTFQQWVLNNQRLNDPKGVYYNFDFLRNTPQENWTTVFQKERKNVIVKHLGISPDKVTFVDHHTAHAYYAYFASPIDRSQRTAVITADGWGDGCNATISLAENEKIKEVRRTDMCNLARIYRWITLLLGMKPYEHEYKVMGLAPYANDYVKKDAYKIFSETLIVDGIDFKWNKKPTDMYFYFKEAFEREGVRFDGIAGALQQWIETVATQWIVNVLKELKADRLVFSGGLSMNVKLNKIIAELSQIVDFFVPPSGGDESLGIGAAFVCCSSEDRISPLNHVYLGSSPSEDETETALKEYEVSSRFNVVRNPTDALIAELLANGKVFARCIGNMEFGARALGNRSILCDPSKWENVAKINAKIKFRDFWMPFTPSILAERAKDYIINPKGLKAPFMTVAFESTPLARDHLKAAIHPYDHTVRAQLVDEETNPEYYRLIKAFEKRTGIGAVLNTSLNLHGRPIVCSAFDALFTFVNSGLDILLLPGVLIQKKEGY